MSASVADLGNLYLQIGQYSVSLCDGIRDSTGGLRAATVGRFVLLSTVPKEGKWSGKLFELCSYLMNNSLNW